MSRREWSMLSALRGGHVPLNGELKFNFRTKQCLQRRCVGGQRESILHFVFCCAHFVEERRDFEHDALLSSRVPAFMLLWATSGRGLPPAAP